MCDTFSSSALICSLTSSRLGLHCLLAVSGRHPRRKPLSPSKPRAPRRVETSASCAPHCLSSPLCLFVSLWAVVPAGSLRRDPLRLVGGNAAQQTRFPQEVEAGEAFQTRRGESGDCSAGRAAAAGLHVCLSEVLSLTRDLTLSRLM